MSDREEWVNQIHEGDVRAVLDDLPESSIHCAVTSPPYWGLRDYHEPDQIGLEPTVEEYVTELVAVGRKLRRVLREDGSWWLNLGDTFAGSDGVTGKPDDDDLHDNDSYPDEPPVRRTEFTQKTKLLVPHRVAIALIDDGWIVRSDAVWAKTNGMPSSVKDRLNETKEFVFHLTPQPDYWFDLDSIRTPHKNSSIARDQYEYRSAGRQARHCPPEDRDDVTVATDKALHPRGGNPGDVFEIGVAQCSVSHFATYPEQLIESPIKATCPPVTCAACGTPYDRETETTYRNPGNRTTNGPKYTDRGHESPQFDQRLEAVHIPGAWTPECECETDATEPGIVLDPFAGAGTTCRVAKRLGRRFVGIELNPEYVALAQQRAGIDVDEPNRLSEDGQLGLAAFADGGEAQ